jgi:hypothetical protein
MRCSRKDIKDFLPAYIEQGLDQEGVRRIEGHLAACADCRSEAGLLRMMAEEAVPDPGPAFWASLPDRVYRQVQEEFKQPARTGFGLDRFLERFTLPRRAFAAATLCIALTLSWFIARPFLQDKEVSLSQGYELSDPGISFGSVNMAELDTDEITAVDSWAAEEITSIAHEVALYDANNHGTDIAEELAELNQHEIDRLSKMIEQLPEEV